MYLIFRNIEFDFLITILFQQGIYYVLNEDLKQYSSTKLHNLSCGKTFTVLVQKKKSLFLWHIKPIALHHYISFRVIVQQTVLRKILFVVKYVYQATNAAELF